jgi:hypothetical protein
MRARFKDKSMQEIYETCRRLAADQTSEFYHAGSPRSGAAHRNAYWNGRRGMAATLFPRGSLSYACWRAGADDFRAAGNTIPELPKFIAAQAVS